MKSKRGKSLQESKSSLLGNLLSALGKHDIQALEHNSYVIIGTTSKAEFHRKSKEPIWETLCYWLYTRTWETAWKQRGSYTALRQNRHKHPSCFGKNSPALKGKKVSLFLCSFQRKYLFHQKCLNIRGSWCFNPKCIHHIIFYKLLNSAKI